MAKCTNVKIKVQTGSGGTLFATWDWSKDHTETFQYEWRYYTGDGVAFVGSEGTSNYKQTTYSPPENATRVQFKVKPISKKHTVNDVEQSYWTAEWSTTVYFNISDVPPTKPENFNVEVENLKLTATVSNVTGTAKEIEFKVIKNNTTIYKKAKIKLTTGYAKYSCNLVPGAEYKVCCRGVNGNQVSDWTEYTDNKNTPPSKPGAWKDCYALNTSTVLLNWVGSSNAKQYEIQYTNKRSNFEDSPQNVQSITIEAIVRPDSKYARTEITGLNTGYEYFFRVRAINDNGNSDFNSITSVVLGRVPSAPTTWSSTTTAVVGEPVTLEWMHNSEDGSKMSEAIIKIALDTPDNISPYKVIKGVYTGKSHGAYGPDLTVNEVIGTPSIQTNGITFTPLLNGNVGIQGSLTSSSQPAYFRIGKVECKNGTQYGLGKMSGWGYDYISFIVGEDVNTTVLDSRSGSKQTFDCSEDKTYNVYIVVDRRTDDSGRVIVYNSNVRPMVYDTTTYIIEVFEIDVDGVIYECVNYLDEPLIKNETVWIAYYMENSPICTGNFKYGNQVIAKESTSDEEVLSSFAFHINSSTKPHTPGYVFHDGSTVTWSVCTKGLDVYQEYSRNFSEYSVERIVNIYAPPSLTIDIRDSSDNEIDTSITNFPFYIYGTAGPESQTPIGYLITVTANESYDTTDETGKIKTIRSGEVIYTKYFDIDSDLVLEMNAWNIDLENNISYTINGTVSMNSGLTATDSREVTISLEDEMYEPNAEIAYNKDNCSCSITPYCKNIENAFKPENLIKGQNVNVEKSKITDNSIYILANEYEDSNVSYILDENKTYVIEYSSYNAVMTLNGTNIYINDVNVSDGFIFTKTDCDVTVSGVNKITFSLKKDYSDKKEYAINNLYLVEEHLIQEILLSVYRKEFDGSFTEIMKEIPNNLTTIIDLHPSLNNARYRIVAISSLTGALSYTDVIFGIEEKSIIIQWDEEWEPFNTDSPDELADKPFSGSLLRLPYNIDVNHSYNADVAHIEYIGRKHPVSYYGTQLGETATWTTSIPIDDEETIYALRRLSVYMGDVYVREPSGTGYWATIKVQFPLNHLEVSSSVSISLTRVEGGA